MVRMRSLLGEYGKSEPATHELQMGSYIGVL